jgi:hypothetical protein
MRRHPRKLVPKSPEPPRISPVDAAALLLASMAACGHAECAAKAAAGDLGLMGEDGEPRSLTPDELRLARAKASMLSPTGVPGQGEMVHVVTDFNGNTQIYDVSDLMAALANTTN